MMFSVLLFSDISQNYFVRVSPNGTTPSLLNNKRGTWNYVFSKSGKTNGNTPGTATTSTAFTDTYNGTPGTTNYIVTITDSFIGIRNQVTNSIGWGLA